MILAPLLLFLAAAPGPAAEDPAGEARRERIAKELIALGRELEREIRAGDASALLARVPPDGLRCGGRVVPHAKVARDLRSERSWLHATFFGGAAATSTPGRPGSLAALFRAASEIAVVVSFQPDRSAGAVGRPCLEFRAKGLVTPGAPLCFEARGGRWWFAESLYPCG